MALAFWGGFASGMSESIDRNKIMKAKQDQLQVENTEATNKQIADNQKMQYKLVESTRDALTKVNERIAEIRGKDSGLTPSERVRENNRLMEEKANIIKSSSERSIQIGDGSPEAVGSMSNEPIEKLGTVTVDGKKYNIDYETASAIQESNGKLKFFGNEIKQRVPDGNGGFKYETMGDGKFLTPFEDTFATDTKGENLKATSTGISGMMSEDEKQHHIDLGRDPEKVSVKMHEVYMAERTKTALKDEASKTKTDRGTNFIDERLDAEGDNPITWGTKVTGQDIADARAATPKGTKMDAGMKKELSGKLGIYSDGAAIIDYISENDVDFDISESAKIEIQKLAGESFEWSDIKKLWSSDEDKLSKEELVVKKKTNAAMINRITADTALKNMVANYVKIISGAAVTDKERTIFYDIITGGQYADETARMAAMTAFVDSIGSNYRNTMDSIKYDNPAEYVTGVKAFNDADKSGIISKAREKNVATMNANNQPTDTTPVETEKKDNKPKWYEFKG